MRGFRLGRRSEDEGERPFWISFADLMTALMVLFLVVMVVSLISLNRAVAENNELADRYRTQQRADREQAQRVAEQEAKKDEFWNQLERSTRALEVSIDRRTGTINFGDRGRFALGSDRLDPADQTLLRRFVPLLLDAVQSPAGRRVVNRVNVEGYADTSGTYLGNLNLSSNRSQRVLCTLLADGAPNGLSNDEKDLIRSLFVVGGFSSNNLRKSPAASRRVEISVDLLGANERRQPSPRQEGSPGSCPLGG
jgi:outer membrane protein OmpA-like peptidoglycan-associated protein